jgi:hypothetical protein
MTYNYGRNSPVLDGQRRHSGSRIEFSRRCRVGWSVSLPLLSNSCPYVTSGSLVTIFYFSSFVWLPRKRTKRKRIGRMIFSNLLSFIQTPMCKDQLLLHVIDINTRRLVQRNKTSLSSIPLSYITCGLFLSV